MIHVNVSRNVCESRKIWDMNSKALIKREYIRFPSRDLDF